MRVNRRAALLAAAAAAIGAVPTAHSTRLPHEFDYFPEEHAEAIAALHRTALSPWSAGPGEDNLCAIVKDRNLSVTIVMGWGRLQPLLSPPASAKQARRLLANGPWESAWRRQGSLARPRRISPLIRMPPRQSAAAARAGRTAAS